METLNKLITDIFNKNFYHTEQEWNISTKEQLGKILNAIVNKDTILSLSISVYFLIQNIRNSKIISIDEFPIISISNLQNKYFFNKSLNEGYYMSIDLYNNLIK